MVPTVNSANPVGATKPSESLDARSWFIAHRWQAFRGEVRANLVRMLGVLLFYGVHLATFARIEQVAVEFHRAVTWVVIAWSLVVLLVFFCLHRRYLPAWLKYFTTLMDVVLLTWIATLGAAAASPIVVGYFVIVSLAAVRMRLRLVWCAATACIAAYLFLVATIKNDWWGNGVYSVEPVELLMVLAGLVVAGIVSGQVVRAAGDMTRDYSQRVGVEFGQKSASQSSSNDRGAIE